MHIYFSGIGGYGIGPLAQFASEAGYLVSGSDLQESPLTMQLREGGSHITIGQDGKYIFERHTKDPIDWFVYSSALPDDHPELDFARRHHIKISKRHELLSYIIDQKGLAMIAVAGTHGKTTTTAMLVWMYRELGLPASYSIGSTVMFGPSGHYDPDSQFFFYECDEYDRNFLNFHPNMSLITSADYDHPDTYPTEQDYRLAFNTFAHQSQTVICWPEDAAYTGIGGSANVVTPELDPEKVGLHGAHNRRNAALAAEAIHQLTGDDVENLAERFSHFPGTSRRFEKLTTNLYSDYAHHPTEIASTLQMAREFSDHVVVVYQPHQNRRQHEIKDDYKDCMQLAERIYWLPTHLSREDANQAILSPQELTASLTNRDKVVTAQLDEALWRAIGRERYEGKLVLLMGAGTIDAWAREQLRGEVPL